MRWQFLFCLSIFCLAFVKAKPTLDSHQWERYKIEFNKNYKSVAEETHRRRIFDRNVQQTDQRVKKIDQFTDMDDNEMPNSLYSPTNDEPMYVELPPQFDWRQNGSVTKVKDRGNCEQGDWAFAVTGALETKLFLKDGKLLELSEQDLIDCTKTRGNFGCNGGTVEKALDYVDQNGILTEEACPYKAVDSDTCPNAARVVGKNLNIKCDIITTNDEAMMKQKLATMGPLMAIIDGSQDSFLNYKKEDGIYQDENCDKSGDLNVLIVGYGETEEKEKYWIVKNSKGINWGDEGYIKIAREKNNTCGIATNVTFIGLQQQ